MLSVKATLCRNCHAIRTASPLLMLVSYDRERGRARTRVAAFQCSRCEEVYTAIGNHVTTSAEVRRVRLEPGLVLVY